MSEKNVKIKGTLYGIGVGPGDPELMTLKAVRIIKECDVIAVPGHRAGNNSDNHNSGSAQPGVAYQIAMKAVPEIKSKELAVIRTPMIMDTEKLKQAHEQGADIIAGYLSKGLNVAFLTLGDPTVYSTFFYFQMIIHKRGFNTEIINGIPSFCAAAGRGNIPLSIWNQQIHIVPAAHSMPDEFLPEVCYVFMKPEGKLKEIRNMAIESGKNVLMVENCGMEDEHIYGKTDDIPDDAGYYSLLIVSGKS